MKRIFNHETGHYDYIPSENYGPNKVLTTDAEGNARWEENVSGGGDFIVELDEHGGTCVTPFEDILSAYEEGKMIKTRRYLAWYTLSHVSDDALSFIHFNWQESGLTMDTLIIYTDDGSVVYEPYEIDISIAK